MNNHTDAALTLVGTLRDLMIDGDDWREEVNGADFVDAMCEALDLAGFGPKKGPITYHDGRTYLELHALRAPVGGYRPDLEDSSERYDFEVQEAIRTFETSEGIRLLQLGRSGRHICIEDTTENRRRYFSLQRKAIDAAEDLWASMRPGRARR